MGFWGSLVLCRPPGELGDVAAIASRDESVTEAGRPGGAWRIGQGEDTALIDDAEAFLRDLVVETGAPALLGYVVDSDCVDVVALGPASGLWRSCLDRPAMEAYAEGGALDRSILLPDAAAERAAEWAEEAGLQPDPAALRSVFASAGDQLFAEALFFELVDALGVAAAQAPPPAPPAAPRRRPGTRPANPLDAFVFDHAAELLAAAGFRKRGRVFSRTSERGDVAVVQFSSFSMGNLVDLKLDGGVSARPVADFAAELHGSRPASVGVGETAWRCDWPAPVRDGQQWPSSTWSVREQSERAPMGEELARTLAQDVVPTLMALLDRATLIDVVQHRSLVRGRTAMGSAGVAAVLLADEGPSVALDLAMRALGEHPFDRSALAWVRRRLAEQGHPDDGWRDGVGQSADDPSVRLAALLAAEVDGYLGAAGYTRTGTQYRLTSGRGDHALVELSPLVTAPGEAVRFRLCSAVLPGPELDWRRARAAAHPEWASGPIEPGASIGWLPAWHLPPPAHAATGGPLPALDAGLWTFAPGTAAACGAAVVDSLDREVTPRMHRLLDRTELLATVLDPATKAYLGYGHPTIVLLVDDGPSDRLEAALQGEEAGPGPTDPELAAWARERLRRAGGG